MDADTSITHVGSGGPGWANWCLVVIVIATSIYVLISLR